MAYKVLNGLCPNRAWITKIQEGAPQTRAATDGLTLKTPFSRLDLRKNFFTVGVTEKWNRLPYKVRAAKTVAGFKRALKNHHGATVEG